VHAGWGRRWRCWGGPPNHITGKCLAKCQKLIYKAETPLRGERAALFERGEQGGVKRMRHFVVVTGAPRHSDADYLGIGGTKVFSRS